jgi:hypothetical protein
MKNPRDVPGIAGRVSTIPAGKAEEALLMLIQGSDRRRSSRSSPG